MKKNLAIKRDNGHDERPALRVEHAAENVSNALDKVIFDFIAAGVLLFGSGIAIEIALRLITRFRYRVAACLAILFVLAVVWAELAVGIFGSPIAGS